MSKRRKEIECGLTVIFHAQLENTIFNIGNQVTKKKMRMQENEVTERKDGCVVSNLHPRGVRKGGRTGWIKRYMVYTSLYGDLHARCSYLTL